jgi:hypothetical protein
MRVAPQDNQNDGSIRRVEFAVDRRARHLDRQLRLRTRDGGLDISGRHIDVTLKRKLQSD